MAFYHGIQVQEKQTRVVAPVQVDYAVQVVVGLAPINMAARQIRWYHRWHTAMRRQ